MTTSASANSERASAQSNAVAGVLPAAATKPRELLVPSKPGPQVAYRSAGASFGPEVSLAWSIGLLAIGACIAPRVSRGWLWFELIFMLAALLMCWDALALWLTRHEIVPVLLVPDKGLRGRQGETIHIPVALTGLGKEQMGREVRVAIMPATQQSEVAILVTKEPQSLKLEKPETLNRESDQAEAQRIKIWPWNPEVSLLRRGRWPGPRVGLERQSRFRLWRLRQWFDCPEELRIDADLRPGRQEILRSQIYRALVASQQTPWTGHGRDFERLREYQPGDNYSEIAWKSTARRAAPVTRLFQWEQKQEVYFVVDQSRASGLALGETGSFYPGSERRAPRRLLDLAVETALVGATVALELGDEFGLVTYADEPKSWLRAGTGQSQFHQFRERLLSAEPLPTTADYEALFSEIRVRLRRRAYLLFLADLTERSVSDSLLRGIGLVRSSHAILMTSILPVHARPAFSSSEELREEQDVYGALAGEKENQRLGALSRKMRQLGVQLRYIPAETFLRTAVEGYLESKREQRL